MQPPVTCINLQLEPETEDLGLLIHVNDTWGELLVTSSLEVMNNPPPPHTHICVCVCVFCRKISDNCEGITFFSFG